MITIEIEGAAQYCRAMVAQFTEIAVKLEANEASRQKARAVSVKAKNLQPGDEIEWQYGMGRRVAEMVSGWPDRIDVITSGGVPTAFFDPEERVRVYRG